MITSSTDTVVGYPQPQWHGRPSLASGSISLSPVHNSCFSDNLLGYGHAGSPSGPKMQQNSSQFQYRPPKYTGPSSPPHPDPNPSTGQEMGIHPYAAICNRQMQLTSHHATTDRDSYEQLSNLSLWLENDEAQPYSEPVRASVVV